MSKKTPWLDLNSNYVHGIQQEAPVWCWWLLGPTEIVLLWRQWEARTYAWVLRGLGHPATKIKHHAWAHEAVSLIGCLATEAISWREGDCLYFPPLQYLVLYFVAMRWILTGAIGERSGHSDTSIWAGGWWWRGTRISEDCGWRYDMTSSTSFKSALAMPLQLRSV